MNRDELQRAYAQMIHSYAEWSWWVTLTFEEPVSAPTANRALKKWARAIAKKMLNAHFRLAYVSEVTTGGIPHFHVLIGLSPGHHVLFRADWAHNYWKRSGAKTGFTLFEPYDPEVGWRAALYLAKRGEPEIQVACPRHPECRHKHGCRKAPGPWHNGAW